MYGPSRKALIIGIDDYNGAPLKSCVRDASRVHELLKRNGDGSPNFECKFISSLNVRITKGLLKEQIEKTFTGDDDIALFYFAGHGYLNAYGGYIVTPDFERYDEGISMNDLLHIANASAAKNKIIILDCCYSGAFGKPTIHSKGTSELADGVTILASSNANQTSVENNDGGLFSQLLIDALEGQGADIAGNILPSTIYAYIDRVIGAHTQRPVFKTSVSRFVSVRNVAPSIEPSILRKITEYFPALDAEFKLNPTFESDSKKPDAKNVSIFKELQRLAGVGLVVPVGEEHMYYAAMNSKTCKLTRLGRMYWTLARTERI